MSTSSRKQLAGEGTNFAWWGAKGGRGIVRKTGLTSRFSRCSSACAGHPRLWSEREGARRAEKGKGAEGEPERGGRKREGREEQARKKAGREGRRGKARKEKRKEKGRKGKARKEKSMAGERGKAFLSRKKDKQENASLSILSQ